MHVVLYFERRVIRLIESDKKHNQYKKKKHKNRK